MSKSYYDIYTDESCIHSGNQFYFGAIYCSPTRADILKEKLQKVREKYKLTAEMKWTKVSSKMLIAYQKYVDVFLDDNYARFIVMRVHKDRQWRKWGKNEEERFFKSYYVFLEEI